MIKKVAFLSFLLGIAIVACSASSSSTSSSSTSSSSTSSSSTSSSSSGTINIACEGEQILVGPIDGDSGLPYFENDVYACRQFGPGSYTFARVVWGINGPCQSAPFGTWTIAPTNAIDGFIFAKPIDLSTNDTFPISAFVDAGNSLFVCAVLYTYSHENRSCLSGCKSKIDIQSFWGDTDIDGFTVQPPSLEPLYASPTSAEASQFENDMIRLMIEAK